ncbi:MAG: dephospho-CoA kinase [Pseudonocardiales bacterium]|nr:MAG: dephospho-CoA kinase [Pseudonocardiales bacterium]
MVGLTGGVGAGKSAVSALLAGHGAVVVDADAIAREVVEPGTPGYDAVVARFGPGVVAADGRLDRPAIAAIVFEDEAARKDLNGIVHPLVGTRSAELMAAIPEGAIVVYDVPLLAEGDLAGGFDCVVVVEADEATRLTRLAERGLPATQARARMAAQASDEQRRAIAHEVINNDGSREALADQVRELWQRLVARRDRSAGETS